MQSKVIRKKFFDFFTSKNHTFVPSSSLLPAQDPTLLFANAGMNQFKDIFLGKEQRSYKRVVSIQKCVRAGGKHNDLDNVGFTKRHLTFFEMMGNFSFGDYFKKKAIQFAWEFLTKIIGLPADKLHVTVFETDQESYDIWKSVIGVSVDRIHKLGAEDNFWQMGETGPCGPCTEILLDRGDAYGPDAIDNSERFLELWNLVFMQYDRQPDGSAIPLKATGVDTGMGLERLAVVLQNKDSVFETDLFSPLIREIEHQTGLTYNKQSAETKAAFHVLADHIRSSCLLIADGAAPSNEGRGYVLRKIIRRAALFAQKLEVPDIFPALALVFIKSMSDIYPALAENQTIIINMLKSEIAKFEQNLIRGQAMLSKYMKEHAQTKIVEGDYVFTLYDTFGFPVELTKVIAHDNGFKVDEKGFAKAMEQQKKQSAANHGEHIQVTLPEGMTTDFTGYDELETAAVISGLVHKSKLVDVVSKGEQCWLIADRSPFFIVGGGQVPDKGWLLFNGLSADVEEVQFIGNAIGVKIVAPKDLMVGEGVVSRVNKSLRLDAMKNHTATHLLQSALIQLLGKQVKQSGSLVHPDYLRFDFTYHRNITEEEIRYVENSVNAIIRDNIPVDIEYTTFKDALAKGALAFFGDKYNPESVRLVKVGSVSSELCGGTHVSRTGDIGVFKITEVKSLSAGHRRIVALTGKRALYLFQHAFNAVKELSVQFKVKKEEIVDAVGKQQNELKDARQQIKQLKQKMISYQLPLWLDQIELINSIPFLYLTFTDSTMSELRDIGEALIQKQPGFYVLVGKGSDKDLLFSMLSKEFLDSLSTKQFVEWLGREHFIKGGGAKNRVQGAAASIPDSLKNSIKKWIEHSHS